MSLEITGKLIQKMPLLSGTSKAGNNWQKQEFVIETLDQYPKKICTNLWGDRIDQLNAFNIGDMITIYFDIESREYNGRWYTDVKSWRVSAPTNMAQPQQMGGAQQMAQPQGGYNQPVAPNYGSAPVNPAPAQGSYNAPANNLPDANAMAEDDTTDDLPF